MIVEVFRSVVKPHVLMWTHDYLTSLALWLYRPYAGTGRGRDVWRIRLADMLSGYAVRCGSLVTMPQIILGPVQKPVYKISRSAHPWGQGPVWQILWHVPRSYNYVTDKWEPLPNANHFCYASYDGYKGGTALLLGYGMTVERYGYDSVGDCKQFWSD